MSLIKTVQNGIFEDTSTGIRISREAWDALRAIDQLCADGRYVTKTRRPQIPSVVEFKHLVGTYTWDMKGPVYLGFVGGVPLIQRGLEGLEGPVMLAQEGHTPHRNNVKLGLSPDGVLTRYILEYLATGKCDNPPNFEHFKKSEKPPKPLLKGELPRYFPLTDDFSEAVPHLFKHVGAENIDGEDLYLDRGKELVLIYRETEEGKPISWRIQSTSAFPPRAFRWVVAKGPRRLTQQGMIEALRRGGDADKILRGCLGIFPEEAGMRRGMPMGSINLGVPVLPQYLSKVDYRPLFQEWWGADYTLRWNTLKSTSTLLPEVGEDTWDKWQAGQRELRGDEVLVISYMYNVPKFVIWKSEGTVDEIGRQTLIGKGRTFTAREILKELGPDGELSDIISQLRNGVRWGKPREHTVDYKWPDAKRALQRWRNVRGY